MAIHPITTPEDEIAIPEDVITPPTTSKDDAIEPIALDEAVAPDILEKQSTFGKAAGAIGDFGKNITAGIQEGVDAATKLGQGLVTSAKIATQTGVTPPLGIPEEPEKLIKGEKPIKEREAKVAGKDQKLIAKGDAGIVKKSTPTEALIDDVIDSQRDDIDAAGMSFIESMMAGDDPLAEKAFNWEMQKLGPIFTAANDNLVLSLKQQGIFGTNAGSAWLGNMARRQGVQVSDIVSKLGFESMQRIEEWNRYGPERANQIQSNRLNYKIDKYDYGMTQIKDLQLLGETDVSTYMNVAASNGVSITRETAKFISDNIASENEADVSASLRELQRNYNEIEGDFESQVPGLAFDASAYASLTVDQQADVRSRISEVKRAIQKNDVELAQELMKELKELYPDAIIGDYEEWNPADFRTHADNLAIQTFKADAKLLLEQGDESGAANILISKVIDPTTIDSNFEKLWETTSPAKKAELIEAAGLDGEPITSEDKAVILAQDMLSGMQTSTTEEIFQSYFENAKGVEIDGVSLQEWMLIPENETLTRSWIFQVTSGPYEIDDNGIIKPVEGQQLPPWNADSNNAHYFTDWAMADSYDEEADEVSLTYDGNNAYDDDNEFQTSNEYMDYRSEMDKAWESYKKTPGNDLTRQEWFDSVKPVWDGETVTFNGTAGTRDDTTSSGETTDNGIVVGSDDPSVTLQNYDKFTGAIKSGDVITSDDVVWSLDQLKGTSSIPSNANATDDFLSENSVANPDGWINYNNLALQVVEGGGKSDRRTKHSLYKLTDEDGGGTFSLSEHGVWYATDLSRMGEISLDDYEFSQNTVFPLMEMSKPPDEMTKEELESWSDYGEFLNQIMEFSEKAAGIGTPGLGGPKLSGLGQIQGAMSYEEWIEAGQPDTPIRMGKDEATDHYNDQKRESDSR